MTIHICKWLQRLLVLACLFPFSVTAAQSMADLLEVLRENGNISQAEYERLMDSQASEVTASEGKFVIESPDGNSFQPIGRIFWDQLWTESDGSPAIFEGGSELRRARLGIQGTTAGHWKYKLEYDFAGSDADLKDGWIAYGDSLDSLEAKYEVKAGQHHVPFGLATISSSKYMTFARRPLFADGPLSPARQAGLAGKLHHPDYRWMVVGGYFYNEPGDGAAGGPGDNARTRALRVTGIPWKSTGNRMLHVGASWMNIDQNGDDFRVRQRAITHLDNSRLFDTGTIVGGIDGVTAFDLEALLLFDNFYAMGESVQWSVDATAGAPDFDLSAWSVEAGMFLTGESKGYKGGQLGSIKPNRPFPGGLGAWEVGIRFENMDLNDGMMVGGDGDVMTVGVNWYPVKNVRLMLDYNKLVDFDRPGNINDGREPSSVTLRTMVYW